MQDFNQLHAEELRKEINQSRKQIAMNKHLLRQLVEQERVPFLQSKWGKRLLSAAKAAVQPMVKANQALTNELEHPVDCMGIRMLAQAVKVNRAATNTFTNVGKTAKKMTIRCAMTVMKIDMLQGKYPEMAAFQTLEEIKQELKLQIARLRTTIVSENVVQVKNLTDQAIQTVSTSGESSTKEN